MKRTFAIIVTVLVYMSGSPLPAQVISVLHSFTNLDGAEPYAGVTASGNTLIGTTKFGGGTGSGVVYSVNTDGTGFGVLHSFTYADGGDITAGVLLSGGTLYGAAYQGGSGIQQGDLYSLAQTGASFSNIYNFSGAPDGDDPKATLLLSGNTLYGTASTGTGGSSDGTIFSIETNGASFTLLHTFTGADGNEPLGQLVLGNNVLYGTTYNGGAANKGEIFCIQTNGSNFMLLHSFSNTDGTFPAAGLVLSGGTLFGTASAGGKYGSGTVFSLSTNGANFTVLYNFGVASTNGATPLAALYLSSNVLYGTTSSGGSTSGGTVFSINTNGSNFMQLFTFDGSGMGPDDPVTPVILLGNSLYGTTVVGGNSGNGTVFGLQISGVVFTFEPDGITNAVPGGGVGFGAGGESLSFPTATIQYQWRLNGVNIPGQTTEGISFGNVQPANGGSMTMTISDGSSAATSVPVGFSVAIATVASGNDNFASRFSLGKANGGVVSSSNVSATREAGEPEILADNPGGKSIWFKWQPTNTGTAIFSTQGSQFDTMMGAYTGTSVGALTRVPSAVNDDDAGGYLTSKVTFACVSGTEYEIVVDGYWGASGVVALSWTNVVVGAALPSFLQVPPTQTIASNGASVTLVCQPNSGVPSWFFNGQSTGVTATNFVINAVGDSNVGTYIAQVTNSAGTASTEPVHVQINSLEDGTSDPNSVVWNKFLDSTSAAYSNPPQPAIRKLGGGGDTRGYSVAQTFSSVGATGEPGEPSIAGQIGGSPVWYTYVAPTNGAMLIDTAGSSFNTMLGVFVGPGNSFATLTNLGAGYTTNSALNGQPQVYVSNVPVGQTNFIVVDGYGGASGTVHLNINLGAQVVIGAPPQSQFVVAGSNATFTVGADGSTPLSYVWQFNGTNIAGATSPSLTVSNVQNANAGLYTVLVSNLVSVASNSATLSIGTVPSIVTQPASQFVAAGSTATLTVTANGTPPPAYQWQFNGGNTGTNGTALSIPNFQSANQGSYSVIVSNAVQAVASTNALVLLSGTPLTLTASNRAKTYGQTVTFAGTEFAASDVANNNPVSSLTLSSAGSAATATVPGSPYPIVPSAAMGAGLNNYTITYSNGALTVNSALLTVTASNRTKLYGQTVTFAGTEFSTSGLLNSDKVNSATLNSPGAGATATVAGSPYPIVPSVAVGAGLSNYTIAYTNGSLTVGVATPTITWSNPAPIIYGTALTTNQLNAAANVPGSFAYIPTNGTALKTGSNTLSAIFTPTDTTDYTTASNTVILVVSPAFLTVTAANANRPYGQANPMLTGVVVGVTIGDAITAIYNTAATIGSPPGMYAIVPSLQDPNNTQTNYTVSLVNGTLTVGLATPIITWASPGPIIYGATLTSNQLSATANVPGGFAYNPTNGTALDTGPNMLSVIFTPTDTVDYSGATDTVSLVVSPASLTVTAGNANRQYGQANPVLTGVVAGVANGDAITATYSTTATASSPVGMYAIVPSLLDPNNSQTNYTVSLVNGALTVGVATPTITWTNPAPIIYGTTLTSNQLNATANVPGISAYNPGNGAALNTGANSLGVIFTPADAVDYASVTDMVSLVVSPAPLTVTASSVNRPFGADNPVFTGTITGLTNNDNITATFSTTAAATSPAGMYAIVPTIMDPDNRETNYTVTLIDGTLTVTPEALGITMQPSNQSVVLGGSASFSVAASGDAPLVYQWQFGGTNLAFATNTVLVLNAVASTNAGSYDVFVTNSSGSITSATATLSVLGVPVFFVTTSGGIQFVNGQLHLSLSGLTGQGPVLIEASSDLTHWTPVFTNPPGFGTIQFIDPATANFGSRYYRVTTPAQ